MYSFLHNVKDTKDNQIATRIVRTGNVNSEEKVDRLAKQTKFDTNLTIHYTREKRFQSNKKDIH
jgi:ribosomal 50S subunit-recycling heat shock protein